MKKSLVILASLVMSNIAAASFFIDYQGLERPVPNHLVKESIMSPNGYKLLTDDLQGVVVEIGKRPKLLDLNSNFADDTEFKFAVGAIMPKGWAAYVDERLSGLKEITFSSEKEPWLNVLVRVGVKYGYKYIVNWNQKIVQISEDANYIVPDLNTPISTSSQSGSNYYIYKTQQSLDKGYMIIDGEMVEIKIED